LDRGSTPLSSTVTNYTALAFGEGFFVHGSEASLLAGADVDKKDIRRMAV